MIRNFLPRKLNNELFGDRTLFGTKPDETDKDWKKWTQLYPSVYFDTQKAGGIQRWVNNAGYEVMKKINLENKEIAEIGPGLGYVFNYFSGKPASYCAIDVCEEFFPTLAEKTEKLGIRFQKVKVEALKAAIDIPSESVDALLTFYSLEHLWPLENWLDELFSKIRPGGCLIGAIPTEGGLAWGLGRWMTSRRILNNKYNLDIRKIVCWEHPNFCDKVLEELKGRGQLTYKRTWPLPIGGFDTSLIVKFIVKK